MTEIEIKKASEIKLGENYQARVLIYGDSGTGKTWSIRTFPKPIFVIDTDQGILTNRDIEGIDFVEIPPDRIAKGTFPEAWRKFEKVMDHFFAHKDEYKTLVWDSLTTIADAALAHLMHLNRHQITGSKDDQGASLPDYNMEKQFATDQLMRAIGSGKHFVCICHEEIVKNELLGVVARLPAARGQLQGKIGKWFAEIYHPRLKVDKDGKMRGYWMVKSDSPMYVCKTRLGNKEEIEAEQLADFSGYAKKCGVELK
jgi:hypothetical protein